MNIRQLSTASPSFESELLALLNRGEHSDDTVEATVRKIISDVQKDGDTALIDYTNRFDDLSFATAAQFEIPRDRLKQALEDIAPALRQALEQAAQRIRRFHEKQQQTSWRFEEADGTVLGQQISALDRVGLYVPGGKAAYPSSVLMTAIPAKVAGVREIIMLAPTPRGEVNEAVLAAAALSGVDKVFSLGGAQAVAALAYGTETIPAVDKIVGPGNIYVATAKRLVFGQVGIDMIAGPSEVVVVCDDSTNPEWAAMDLFAQAEHDELAQSILISSSEAMIDRVKQAVAKLLPDMSRKNIIRQSLLGHGAFIKTSSNNESLQIANRIAPEHLELLVDNAEELLPTVKNAGAVFVGHHSAESLGDYCAGPNHVLPTSGTARFSSPLGVEDFQKRTSIIQCSAQGASVMAGIASTLAEAEALTAHAKSARLRS